jgi:pimeloyl-ACP methyl ester carboxylesterase
MKMVIKHPDGTETFLQEAGNPANEAIVLLHGIGADHNMWTPQIQAFADQGFFVLAPDMLAHGQSSKVKTLTLRDWEYQINELLRQKDLKSCILIGVSMGGVIAQSYAMNNPDKVSRLILSDTFGELKTLPEKVLGFSQVAGFKIYKLLGRERYARAVASAYKPAFAKQARDYLSTKALEANFEQLTLARKAINKIDAIGKIDGAGMPTLAMVGDQFGESFIEINRKIAAGINGSKFVVLSESMDPSNLVNPEAFNQEVLVFLQDTSVI